MSSKSLVDAGFYYANLTDKVVCFNCGIGLENYLKGDDPWYEHVLIFPSCEKIKERKGANYVDSVMHSDDKSHGMSHGLS